MTALALVAPADAPDVPVDHRFLERQVPGLVSDHSSYYLKHGLAAGIDPTPWFVTDWYAWQNPDWSIAHDAPYLHYLNVGRQEGRDPSPFVDIHRYRQSLAGTVPVAAIYDLILKGYRSPALGVTTPDRLRQEQQAFLSGIACVAHRMRPPPTPRRALVVLQAGRASLAGAWFSDEGREWDLLVNYYDASGFRPGFGEYACFQKGTKFTAMWYLAKNHFRLIDAYEHVLFLDDDIQTGTDALNRLFAACRRHDLDLAQMTLCESSSCNWPELFSRAGCHEPRPVSAVEIMMPVFSRRAFKKVASTFGQSISGFGLDLVWGKIIGNAKGRVAVLDDIVATHRRPVDQANGAYYSYLRRAGINPKAELWALLQAYDAARDVVGCSGD